MRYLLSSVLLLVLITTSFADKNLEGIACRSVHLGYPGDESIAFYNEMKVEKSAEGTYFMATGWSKGYFGIQELSKDKKLVIFSVWDPTTGDDPKKVDPAKRVQLLFKNDAVRTGRFGGEGTGGQSFLDYNWKVGETYRFIVTARPDGKDRTAYSGYFYIPEKKEWMHMVTFSTLSEGKLLDGFYSFVEDFKRNRESARQERKAQYGNGWIKNLKGDWIPLAKARFTGDSNPVLNIDAGPVSNQFFLSTGGNVENKTTTLNQLIQLEKNKFSKTPPADLPDFSKK
jgi:Domain of unknown function (DUF3472)/Domain of unknown function (DUF5077)